MVAQLLRLRVDLLAGEVRGSARRSVLVVVASLAGLAAAVFVAMAVAALRTADPEVARSVIVPVGTLVTVAATVVSALGPIAGIITVLVVIGILIGFGRMLRRTARSLDRIVEATARVEAGDYSVRVGTPERSMRSVRRSVVASRSRSTPISPWKSSGR